MAFGHNFAAKLQRVEGGKRGVIVVSYLLRMYVKALSRARVDMFMDYAIINGGGPSRLAERTQAQNENTYARH